MDIVSYQQARKAKDALKKTQNRIGMHGSEQGLDIRDVYDTADERITKLEKKDPEVELYNRVSEVSAHTAINLNKHQLRVMSLINQGKYKFKDMIVDDFQDDSGIDYEKSFNIQYDETRGVINQEDINKQAELVLIKEAFEHMGVFFISSLMSAHLRKTLDIDLSKGHYNHTEFAFDHITLVKSENGSFVVQGEYETDIIKLGEDVISIDDIYLDSTIPDGASLRVYIAYSKDGTNFTSYSGNFNGVGNYVKLKFEFEAKLETVMKALSLQIIEGNGIYKHGAFMLNNEKDSAVLKRNIHKYNGIQFDESTTERYRKGSEYMYRIKRTVSKGWNR